jgi:hypothetical protein
MGDSGGPLFEFLLFAMRVEEEAVMAEEYLEAMERAANHKQLSVLYLGWPLAADLN